MKTDCENSKSGVLGKVASGTGGELQSLLGLNGSFDWRHFMVRAAEFGVGLLLIVVAANATLKSSVMGSPAVKSSMQLGTPVVKRIGKKAA
jgi:hypothetical protein